MPCVGELCGVDRHAFVPGADDIDEVEERKFMKLVS